MTDTDHPTLAPELRNIDPLLEAFAGAGEYLASILDQCDLTWEEAEEASRGLAHLVVEADKLRIVAPPTPIPAPSK